MYNPETPILVVDHHASHRKILIGVLKQLGYKNIHSAKDGNRAWQMLKHQVGIEVIISDWEVASGDGLSLLFKIRDDQDLKGLGFVIMSNEGEHDQVLLAIKAGVDLYIKKPFAPKTLKAKLSELYSISISRK